MITDSLYYGDFAKGQRTRHNHTHTLGEFATGMRNASTPTAIGDFATGMRTTSTPPTTGDFATGMRGTVGIPIRDVGSAASLLPIALRATA